MFQCSHSLFLNAMFRPLILVSPAMSRRKRSPIIVEKRPDLVMVAKEFRDCFSLYVLFEMEIVFASLELAFIDI